jgi:hypothetical protein
MGSGSVIWPKPALYGPVGTQRANLTGDLG